MTIGELSRRSGLAVSAIRFYQRRGLLPSRDSGSSWQRYDTAALTRLAIIELAKRTGFTLHEIAVMLEAADISGSPASTWKTMFQAKLAELGEQARRMETMRDLLTEALHCDCLDLDRAALVPTALGWAADTASSRRTPAAPARPGSDP